MSKSKGMAKIKGTIVINNERCKGCGICVEACPLGVMSMAKQVNAKGYNFAQLTEKDGCIGCASCAIMCPDSCIVVYRQRVE